MSNDTWQAAVEALKRGRRIEGVKYLFEARRRRAKELMETHQQPKFQIEEVKLTRLAA